MFTKRRARPRAALWNGVDPWARRARVALWCLLAQAALATSLAGCAGHAGQAAVDAQRAAVSRPRQADARTREVAALKAEIARLHGAVAELSRRLDAQAETLTQAQTQAQAQTEPRLPAPREPTSVADHAQSRNAPRAERSREELERELRDLGRALVRVVSRLELPPDAKRELLQSLRPARQLDLENPWLATK